jgi:glutathione S-transferase
MEEKKYHYSLEKVNILTGENLSPQYLKINPHGTVPTLKLEDGTIIADSTDILKGAIGRR